MSSFFPLVPSSVETKISILPLRPGECSSFGFPPAVLHLNSDSLGNFSTPPCAAQDPRVSAPARDPPLEPFAPGPLEPGDFLMSPGLLHISKINISGPPFPPWGPQSSDPLFFPLDLSHLYDFYTYLSFFEEFPNSSSGSPPIVITTPSVPFFLARSPQPTRAPKSL